jgi:hypothetical protein
LSIVNAKNKLRAFGDFLATEVTEIAEKKVEV